MCAAFTSWNVQRRTTGSAAETPAHIFYAAFITNDPPLWLEIRVAGHVTLRTKIARENLECRISLQCTPATNILKLVSTLSNSEEFSGDSTSDWRLGTVGRRACAGHSAHDNLCLDRTTIRMRQRLLGSKITELHNQQSWGLQRNHPKWDCSWKDRVRDYIIQLYLNLTFDIEFESEIDLNGLHSESWLYFCSYLSVRSELDFGFENLNLNFAMDVSHWTWNWSWIYKRTWACLKLLRSALNPHGSVRISVQSIYFKKAHNETLQRCDEVS